MLGFWHVLKPIKKQDLLENEKKKRKIGRDAFPIGAKLHFSEKNISGVRGTLKGLSGLKLCRICPFHV